jgi:hypothetical protein
MFGLAHLRGAIIATSLLSTCQFSLSANSSAYATASVSIVSPSSVETTALTQVLFITSTGVFTLSIPGTLSSVANERTGGGSNLSDVGIVFTSTDGSLPSSQELSVLTVSDGTLNGGQGVSFTFAGDGEKIVVGTLAYN